MRKQSITKLELKGKSLVLGKDQLTKLKGGNSNDIIIVEDFGG